MNIFPSFYIHVAEMISSEPHVKCLLQHSSQGEFVLNILMKSEALYGAEAEQYDGDGDNSVCLLVISQY